MKAEELYEKHFHNAENISKEEVINLLKSVALINDFYKLELKKREPKPLLMTFMRFLNAERIKQIENAEFEKVVNSFLNK